VNWAVIKDPTILVTSVVYGLLFVLAAQAGMFGIWLGILVLFSFWRYCYTALRAFAQGHKRIHPPDLESFNPVGNWGVLMHFFLFPGLMAVALIYRPGSLILLPFIALAFPASAALMGLTSNIGHALNPAALVEFARTLGPDYRALVAGYVGILSGAFLVLALMGTVSGILVFLIGTIIEIWAILASFALIGSALRAHRLQFEIVGELVPREDLLRKQRHDDWRKDLDIAFAAFRSGLDTSGYNALHAIVASQGDSLEVNHWLVENMLEWDEKKYALEVASKLMPRMLALGDGSGALELYQRCRRREPKFRPPQPLAGQLAECARSFGRAGLADELSYN
jgi:hypothetical protein